jgi:hypothetical protein
MADLFAFNPEVIYPDQTVFQVNFKIWFTHRYIKDNSFLKPTILFKKGKVEYHYDK